MLAKKELQDRVKAYPDFPKKGVMFFDMMPLLASHECLTACVAHLAESLAGVKASYVVGLESRGFLLGVPLAMKLGMGFIPLRKKGKLPGKVISVEYELEYGKDCIEMQEGVLK
ncbi:adenine phosphoribosyltransferase-like [Hippocampus zosterae]|uniref:adenine phosphoribosyltransferase-like n=1 Tax=Hippocampus zosterae TaxID=109293 RepID=UPI00223D0785|nr:adenine phosphoribosyltransferase-like [Hippocampus zosterae]